MLREFVRQLAAIVISVSFVTGSTAIGLRLLKVIPSYIQPGTLTTYESVEAVESALGLRVHMPSYFPEFLHWPAEEIRVEQYDGLILSFIFMLRKEPGIGLLMYQIFSENEERSVPEIHELFVPKSEKHVSVGTTNGVLLSGTGKDGKSWMWLRWELKDRTVVLASACSEKDLLRIARSIHR